MQSADRKQQQRQQKLMLRLRQSEMMRAETKAVAGEEIEIGASGRNRGWDSHKSQGRTIATATLVD